MARKLFSQDIEDEDEIDFDCQNMEGLAGVDLNEQMIRNLDSTDEKVRELSCISIANLSSSMEVEFYGKFLSAEIVKKLVDRITDPYSQISFNSLSALQRLAGLSRVHLRGAELEAAAQAAMLPAVLKAQTASCVANIKAAVLAKIELKEKDLGTLPSLAFDGVTSGKLTFTIKVLQLTDTFLENFSSDFFLSQSMAGLFSSLTELFLIFADLYTLVADPALLGNAILDYLGQYLSLLAAMLEEPTFASQIAANEDLCAKAAILARKDESLVSSNAFGFELM